MQEYLPSITANPSLANMSAAKRDLLEKYLRGEVKQQPAASRTIAPRPPDAVRQLSFAQERLWF
ncbi:MAG TPA: hypothetical protein VF333_02760, partial [Pyrinomonadaceae bacterium]